MLKITNLSYRYLKQELISEISLEFSPGNLYGILGPNGSGKTTFMKTLAGLWNASSGKVLWQAENLLTKSRREISRIVTFVPQNPQLTFEYSVADFVNMGRYTHLDEQPALIEHCLQLVDTWHLRSRQVQLLSSGERQRVYIARALATEAPVLLLDEPAASLDIRHQLEIWHLLKELVNRGKIVIVTNHDLDATRRFCDHAAVFSHGKCLYNGPCGDILTPTLTEDIFGVIQTSLGYSLK